MSFANPCSPISNAWSQHTPLAGATYCCGTVVPLVPSAVYGTYTSATLCPPSPPRVFVCRQRAGGEEGLGRRQPGIPGLNAGDKRRYACVNTMVSRPNRVSVLSLGRGTF